MDFGFLMPADSAGAFSIGLSGTKEVCQSPDEKVSSDEDIELEELHPGRVTNKRVRTGRYEETGCCAALDEPDSVLRPPQASRRPQNVLFGKVHGEDRGPRAMDPPVVRTDVFAWMRGVDNQANEEVRELLRLENEYTEAAQTHLRNLRDILYAEMLNHQMEADTSLITEYPGGFGYFTRTFIGKAYQAHYRCRVLSDGSWGEEELVLDENKLAINPSDGSIYPYVDISGPFQNQSHTLYAYATDFAGNGENTLHVFSFSSGVIEQSQVCLERTDGSVHWGLSGECFYYVELDEEFRQYRVKQHVLGKQPKGNDDYLLLEEEDKRFSLFVEESGCTRFLILVSASSETAEVNLLDLCRPDMGLLRVSSRVFSHQYRVDHCEGWVYILTNKDGTKNSKLCRVALTELPDVPLASWEDIWAPNQGTKLDSHRCFQSFMVIEGREHGQCRFFVRSYEDAGGALLHTVEFPHASAHAGSILTPRGATAACAAFSAHLGENPMFKANVIRYHYESFTVPSMTYEYDVRCRVHRLLRQQEVPNFDPSRYRAERISTMGRSVPISLVYCKDIHPQGLAGGPFPLLLTGYGAYGACQDPGFDGNRLSMLDRGIVYALVHVRGGGELGRSWYEEGRYLAVKNRFEDFIEAAETLINLQIAAPGNIVAWGTSSGGLLVAASVNLRPDIFKAVLLEVPFVDVLNTMSDPSIPLTIAEWEEIGNPNERDYFYYMLEYSPYDNIRMDAYPATLVTACLNDTMVGYWEPLKYVSKLRLMTTAGDRPVLLQANFHAGHGAASDRYKCTRDSAFHFAFLLDQLGLAEVSPRVVHRHVRGIIDGSFPK